jgi:hypothetical protein
VSWKCLDVHPLEKMNEYPSWITEQDVAVMLLDERLHEQKTIGKPYVDYNGHDLVDYIRKRFKTLPIFVITSFSDDDELVDKFSDVEAIIPREVFTDKPKEYVPRFLRAGQKFIDTFQGELSELSERAKKIALGRAKRADVKRANAIRESLNLAFPLEAFRTRDEWLAEMEKNLKDLKKIASTAKRHIETKKIKKGS